MAKALARTSPREPPRVDRYELLLPIASGGMATVYLARMNGGIGFTRNVAMKRIHPHLRSMEEFSRDLVEEAHLAGRIRHANVVPVLDAGEDADGTFLVMEYVEGDTVAGIVRRLAKRGESLPRSVAFRIMDDMLAGLHAAHELTDDKGVRLGVVHRDVSPQNVIVGIDGVARLTDFGIAKASTREALTRTGVTKGKVAYMAPEQARALKVDRAADVWAAGVILWELVAGRRLYAMEDDVAIALQIVTQDAPRLRDVRDDVSVALDAAVMSALTREASDRCPSAAELRRRVADAVRGEIELASAAEVAEWVARASGEMLRERAALLERVEAGEEMSARDVPAMGAPSDNSHELVTHRREKSGSVDVEVTATEVTPARAPRRGLAWGLGIAMAATIGISAFAFVRAHAPREDAPATVESAAPANVPSASASAAIGETIAPVVAAANTDDAVISANATVASAKIGDREIDWPKGAATATVAITEDERKTHATITARAADGRTTFAHVPSAGAAIKLVFATHEHPMPAHVDSPPLMKSPYKPTSPR